MKTRILIPAVLSLLALTACGGGADTSSANANTTHTLQSGTYAVSNVQVVDKDECQLIPSYQAAGASIAITNTSGTVKFEVQNPARPSNEDPASATLDGNALVNPKPAYYAGDALPDGCQLLVNEVVSGSLTADDAVDVQMDVVLSDGSDTPGSCTAADAHATRFPCSSTFSFTAKRTGP